MASETETEKRKRRKREKMERGTEKGRKRAAEIKENKKRTRKKGALKKDTQTKIELEREGAEIIPNVGGKRNEMHEMYVLSSK